MHIGYGYEKCHIWSLTKCTQHYFVYICMTVHYLEMHKGGKWWHYLGWHFLHLLANFGIGLDTCAFNCTKVVQLVRFIKKMSICTCTPICVARMKVHLCPASQKSSHLMGKKIWFAHHQRVSLWWVLQKRILLPRGLHSSASNNLVVCLHMRQHFGVHGNFNIAMLYVYKWVPPW